MNVITPAGRLGQMALTSRLGVLHVYSRPTTNSQISAAPQGLTRPQSADERIVIARVTAIAVRR